MSEKELASADRGAADDRDKGRRGAYILLLAAPVLQKVWLV